MPTEKKAQSIDKLEKEFAKASIGILTDYRGLKTPEINSLRRKLQDVDGDYKVVKNTLARKAAEKLSRSEVTGPFEGPIAIALGYGDISQLAKTFTDHVRVSKMTLNVKGGFLSDRLLTAAEITTLATLPPKEILIAMVVGGIKSPLYMLAGALSGPIRGLQNVLQARIKQMEGNN
ncbi:MAG: 50S ribosomal protein L10 [Dehalococcoidales bacterium]|nr:50S ribosomal protein L10 [Dehalococcoidales bacterium]